MFHVSTKILPSKIHGLGLFANEDIPKNKIVYSINHDLDLKVSPEKFDSLSDNEKDTIKHYGYFDKRNSHWHLSFDDIRFCNHSLKANLTLVGNNLVAKHDINKDDEMTQDYNEFELLRENI